jgi:nucleoside-diphosphate kinase
VHRERPFFNALVELHDLRPGDDPGARRRGRRAQAPRPDGRHQPEEAAPGTIRADFADSIDANAVHGSDSLENAAIEIAYFFPSTDVYTR